MSDVVFITGNQGKADFLAKHMGVPITHKKIEIDEIQSLDLEEVAQHKAKEAYKANGGPVLVEDVALIFEGLGKLPGPFVKWFELELGLEKMCRLVDSLPTRSAKSRVCFVYYDGKQTKSFIGELQGTIADQPIGDNGFGFDPIFIPKNSNKTLAQMNDNEMEKNSLRTTTVYPQLKEFFSRLDKA